MAKTEKFVGKNVDLERLATRIETYLQENKFEVGYAKDEHSSTYLIQARKTGILRTASGSRRSTDITISGKPGNFEVTIGTGEWGKNLVTSAPLFIVLMVGIAATITKLYTAKKFESNLWNFVKDQTGFLQNTAMVNLTEKESASVLETKGFDKEYNCDYVEGHPDWKDETQGRLILHRSKNEDNKLIFKNESREISIPTISVIKTSIISKRKRLTGKDLMVQIKYHDNEGKIVKPVFNLSDDVIRSVLAGIDELIAEEKLHKKSA